MQAVILAGGLGTRLGQITEKIPKPIVEICGKPFLYYLLEYLKDLNIKDVLLLTGYLGEKIEGVFGDGEGMGLNIKYSKEPTPLGTGGALSYAREKLQDIFFLLNGDTLLKFDYHKLFDALNEKNSCSSVITAFCDKNNVLNTKGNLRIDEKGLVEGYSRTADNTYNYIESGVSLYKKEIFSLFGGKERFSLEEEVFPKLIEQKRLWAYFVTEPFYDMGTPQGIERLTKYIEVKE